MVRRSSAIFAATLAVFSTFEVVYGYGGAAAGSPKDDVQKPRFMKKNVKRYYANTTTSDGGNDPFHHGNHNPDGSPIVIPPVDEDSSSSSSSTTSSTSSSSITTTSSTSSTSSKSSSAQQGQPIQTPPPSTTSSSSSSSSSPPTIPVVGDGVIGSDVCGNGGCKTLQEYCDAIKRNGKSDSKCSAEGNEDEPTGLSTTSTSSTSSSSSPTIPVVGDGVIGSDVCGNGGCKTLQEYCDAIKRNGKSDSKCSTEGNEDEPTSPSTTSTTSKGTDDSLPEVPINVGENDDEKSGKTTTSSTTTSGGNKGGDTNDDMPITDEGNGKPTGVVGGVEKGVSLPNEDQSSTTNRFGGGDNSDGSPQMTPPPVVENNKSNVVQSIVSDGVLIPSPANKDDTKENDKPEQRPEDVVENVVSGATIPASVTRNGVLVPNPEATNVASNLTSGEVTPDLPENGGNKVVSPASVPASITSEGNLIPNPEATKVTGGNKNEEQPNPSLGAGPLSSGILPPVVLSDGKPVLPNPTAPSNGQTTEVPASITLDNGSIVPNPVFTATSLPATGQEPENPQGGNGTDYIGSDVCGNGGCKTLEEYCAAVAKNGQSDPKCVKQGKEQEKPETTQGGNGTDYIGSDVCGNGGCKTLEEYCAAIVKNGKSDLKCVSQGASTTLPNGQVVPIETGFPGSEENNGTANTVPVIPVQTEKGSPSQSPLVVPGGASTTLSNGDVVPVGASTTLSNGDVVPVGASTTLSNGDVVPVGASTTLPNGDVVPISASPSAKPGQFFNKQESQAGISGSGTVGNEQQETGTPPSTSAPVVGGQVPTGPSNTGAQPTATGTGEGQNQSPPESQQKPGPTDGPVASQTQVYPSDDKGPFSQQPTGYDQNTVLLVESSITFEPSSAPPTTGTEAMPTGLPNDVPLVLYPPTGKAKRPDNTLLIQIGFLFPLNYDFVWTHDQSQRQIFRYLPLGVAWCLGIDRLNVTMQTLRAWDTTQDVHYITTLALIWIPLHLVDPLQLALQTPAGKFYNHPEPSIRTLLSMVNNAIPLRADNMDDSGTQTGTSPSASASTSGVAPVGGNIGHSSPVKASSVGIGVGVVCGAAAYGAAMFFVARRYKRRRQSHLRSPSMFSSPVMSHAGADPAAGQALMSGAMGGERSVSPYYDRAESRGSARSGGSSGRQQISAPVMAENSLGWN